MMTKLMIDEKYAKELDKAEIDHHKNNFTNLAVKIESLNYIYKISPVSSSILEPYLRS